MARTNARFEGGAAGVPATIYLENDRLAATLKRNNGTYELVSLRAGGERELLARPSPLVCCYEKKERRPAPLDRVLVERQEPGAVSLRFLSERSSVRFDVTLTLNQGRPFLELDCAFQPEGDWEGWVCVSCFATADFVPVAYPWIAGDTVTDRGVARAECMGAPLLFGDPRALERHVLALGFPLSVPYRDLLFHYDARTRQLSAGHGGERQDQAGSASAAEEKRHRRSLLGWLFVSGPEEADRDEEEEAWEPKAFYRGGRTYHLPVHLWALVGEYRNLANEWIRGNSFTFDKLEIRSPADALQLTLRYLREGAPFFPKEGYPMRGKVDAVAPGSGDGACIHLYGSAALATALYACWMRFKEEWMRERALTMANFVVSCQLGDGLIPELYEPRRQRFGSLGDDFHYDGAGLCLESLLRLYELRREAEAQDDVSLLHAVLKAADAFLLERKLRRDRERRRGTRRHDQETAFPYSASDTTESANVNLLIVMERLRQLTNERRYEEAREDGEKWVLHNVYHHMSWRGGSPLYRGLEVFSALRFIEYCLLRHERTLAKRYQEMAEILSSFVFLTLVPKDLEWCSGRTKGMVIANGEWRALTTAFQDGVTPVPELQRLGKVCNDRCHPQLAEYLARTALFSQCDEEHLPGYGGWFPTANCPDGSAFPLNGSAFPGELSITGIVPAVLETYLYLTR
ncbi:MAG: hypothetical protein QHJ73_00555 [Armatimonadota bacterium]|nr:hypothetical protein [Armatimonadota bacterium]